MISKAGNIPGIWLFVFKELITMKSHKNILYTILLSGLVTLAGCGSQKSTRITEEFLINVGLSDTEINMTCQRGCAWTKLSFSTRPGQPVAVDQYGMTNLSEESATSDQEAIADFLFTIERTDNGVLLRGIEGAAWKSLSFSLPTNRTQAINQLGMLE